MSEFSASYHLKTNDRAKVVDLIKNSNNRGYIFAEDHGWELRVFNKDELVFEYKCDWTDEILVEKNLFDIDIIKELIANQGQSIHDIDEIFDLIDYDFEDLPAYQLANKLGLVHYEWLSADNIEDRLDEGVLIVERARRSSPHQKGLL